MNPSSKVFVFFYFLSSFYHLVSCTGAQVFNSSSQSNVAVYFGHSPGNSGANLLDICSDDNSDIVNIGFIRSFTGSAGYPTLDLVSSCQTPSGGATNAKLAQITCTALARNVSVCQKVGKKVVLSIGGSTSNTSFTSAAQAKSAANALWTAFGPDTSSSAWRPLGSVVLDGFDFDQESGTLDYYDVFASTLKSLYASTTTKSFYLTSTFSCAYLSNSTSLVPYVDFIYVRFYNARKCNMGTSGFKTTLSNWLTTVDGIVGSSVLTPKVFLGALAFQTTGTGYVTANAFPTYVKQARSLGSGRFGGVMLWDGTEGLITTNSAGATYVEVAKAALTS